MLNIIQRFTMMKGWKFGRLDGNTNVASRQRLVDTFNSDESYMGLLCTTRTGGVGLNLTGANRIILYDPDWYVLSVVSPFYMETNVSDYFLSFWFFRNPSSK